MCASDAYCATNTTSYAASKSQVIFSTFQIWNLDTMLPMQTLSRHEGSVNCVVIHKDLLLSGSEDMEIKVCFIAVKLLFSQTTSDEELVIYAGISTTN